MSRLLLLALVALLALTGCKRRLVPEDMYERVMRDYQNGAGGISARTLARQEKRYARLRTAVTKGELASAEDYIFSAAVLSTSDNFDDLELSRTLALEGVELGDERGYRVAAEAVDLMAVKLGEKQRYGTQCRYEAVLSSWSLYPVDPRTTDAERAAWGVPPLEELLANVDELNADPINDELRARIKTTSDSDLGSAPELD